ncbi:unnamed protein product, partial [Amoebophrya sp. A120]|eukprot:GSA120T00023608001.1
MTGATSSAAARTSAGGKKPGDIAHRTLDDLHFDVIVLRRSSVVVPEGEDKNAGGTSVSSKQLSPPEYDIMYLDDHTLECNVPAEELQSTDDDEDKTTETTSIRPRPMMRFDADDLLQVGLQKLQEKYGPQKSSGTTDTGKKTSSQVVAPAQKGACSPHDFSPQRERSSSQRRPQSATVTRSGTSGVQWNGRRYKDLIDGTKIVTYVDGKPPPSSSSASDDEGEGEGGKRSPSGSPKQRGGGTSRSGNKSRHDQRRNRDEMAAGAGFDADGNFVDSDGNVVDDEDDEMLGFNRNNQESRPFGQAGIERILNEKKTYELQQQSANSSRPNSSAGTNNSYLESDLELRSLASEQSGVGFRGVQSLNMHCKYVCVWNKPVCDAELSMIEALAMAAKHGKFL